MALGLPSILSLRTTAITGVVALGLGVCSGGWLGYKVGETKYQKLRAQVAEGVAQGEQRARQLEQAGTEVALTTSATREQEISNVRADTTTIRSAIPALVSLPGSALRAGPAAEPPPSERPGGEAVAASGGPLGLDPGAAPHRGLGVGIIRVLDAAALNDPAILSASSGSVDRDGAELDLPALAGSVVDNYGRCWELRAEVVAWRNWYAQQSAQWEALRNAQHRRPADGPVRGDRVGAHEAGRQDAGGS